MNEKWIKSKYSDDIEISNFGRVRRHFKNSTSYYKGNINHDGYLRIKFSIDGKVFNKFSHVLVAEHFIPNPNNFPQINHIDGNKLNNNVNNLEWCTASQNMQHAYDNELKRTDKKHSRSKLNECDVLDIYSSDLPTVELMKKYNISKSAICRIRSGKSWGWLTQHG